MNREALEVLDTVEKYGLDLLDLLVTGQTDAERCSQNILNVPPVIEAIESVVPMTIYNEYREFFDTFSSFCKQCGNQKFLVENVDNAASSLQLFAECMEDMKSKCKMKIKRCLCCGKEGMYIPLPNYYDDMKAKMHVTINFKSETLNKEEYTCPNCGASDRDRLIVSFLEKEGLQEAEEGTRLLQFAPAPSISRWILMHCPQVEYDTTDLYMDHVTFKSDIMDMNKVSDETYDVIICSHVLEHVWDDRKALREMRRILKPDGKIIFLVPVDLNASHIDEEWGLSEEENWKRFGQGDHCRRYDKRGLMQRLEEQFCVHALGKEYFGEEIFSQCGLIDTSTLYILTKSEETSLDMAENVVINEELCAEGPLVSVILPCYNHEEFVEAAIESVINQSYKNIELLVADDGSTDHTADIMKKYSAYFTKEFYFDENAGERCNLLYQYARGKYIALMHSDDVWEKDKLALQVEYMEKHEECGVCLTWCKYVDEKLNELDDYTFVKANRSSYEWMRFFWENGNALCNPSSLARRDLGMRVQKYGGECRQLPDFFKWIDMVQHTSIYIIPKVLIRMRRYQKDGKENTSAVSDVNMIRHSVEEGSNWLCVIRDMDEAFFKEAFRNLMINPDADTEAEIKCEKYFLMLNHRNPFVQNGAMSYFSEIYNEVKECMERKYHYARKKHEEDTISKGLARMFLGRKETN